MFLDKTLYSHSASLHPSVKRVLGDLMLGVALRWTSTPSRGGVEILLPLHARETGDMSQPDIDRIRGSHADLTFTLGLRISKLTTYPTQFRQAQAFRNSKSSGARPVLLRESFISSRRMKLRLGEMKSLAVACE